LSIKKENLVRAPLKNKNFFYVGLSFKWGTLERKIICDCLAAKRAGADVFLYTFRDSALALQAKSEGIDCLFHHGLVATRFVKWHKLKFVSKLLKKHSIDLVHCYDIKILWPLCYFLKSKPLIPLVLTLTKELDRVYRGFWYRPLNRRIDHVFITTEDMNENVWGNLGIPLTKVSDAGLGISKVTEIEEREKPFFKFSDDRWYLGTNLSGVETSIKFLDTLFNALKVLVQNKIAGKEITFVLGSEKNWSECLITDELRRKVKDWGLEQHVAFMGPCEIKELQQDLDLWFSLKDDGPIEDYALGALVNGIPTLLPKTTASMELLKTSKNGFTGLYRLGDTRSLRKQCEEVLANYSTHKETVLSDSKDYFSQFGLESYEIRLSKSYHQLIKRRLRLMRSKVSKI
jgi:glycosyltransferase involved in cell wall biosynthesis